MSSRHRPLRSHERRGFSLVEAAISTLIVAVMLGAGMATMAAAARERVGRDETRTGEALAARLMGEIMQRRFEFPVGSGIGRPTGVTNENRLRWLDVDDYNGLREQPRDRAGAEIAGKAWLWTSTVEYVRTEGLAGVTSATSTTSQSLIDANILGISLNVGTTTTTTTTPTNLKRVQVIVTSPGGRTFKRVAYRSAFGVADGVASDPGFRPFAEITVEAGKHPVTAHTGVLLLNSPAIAAAAEPEVKK